jgi:hypothetical protein
LLADDHALLAMLCCSTPYAAAFPLLCHLLASTLLLPCCCAAAAAWSWPLVDADSLIKELADTAETMDHLRMELLVHDPVRTWLQRMQEAQDESGIEGLHTSQAPASPLLRVVPQGIVTSTPIHLRQL